MKRLEGPDTEELARVVKDLQSGEEVEVTRSSLGADPNTLEQFTREQLTRAGSLAPDLVIKAVPGRVKGDAPVCTIARKHPHRDNTDE